MKKAAEIIKNAISILTGIFVGWILWDSSSWIDMIKSLFIGFISFGIVYAIIESIVKIIKEEKLKKEHFNNTKLSEFDYYEEDMKIITTFTEKFEEFSKMKYRPKKSDFGHDFERINLAFNRLLKSPYLVDEELKLDIGKLRNTFYLMYLDPNWDKDYKEILNRKTDD
jgi:hypothetical protein